MKCGLLFLFGSVFALPGFALDPMHLPWPTIEPECLVPVNPHGREREDAMEKLLGDRHNDGTMIYGDSNGAAFVVSVWGRDYANHDYEHPLHNFITLVEVSLQGEADSTHATSKKRIDVPIDSDFAVTIQRAWATMLLKTRYPTNQYLGLGGSHTEFSVWVGGVGPIYGQIWSPSKGLPKELMDLGFALADYCRSSEAERPRKREKLVNWLLDFAKRAEKA
jgi:hypothetical protein